MLLLVFLHSLLIRNIIQISPFTLNIILLSSKSITLLQILMNYRVPSKLKSPQPNSIIRNPLIYDISLYLISKQVTKSLSRYSFLKLFSLQKSFPKNILDLMESFSSLVYYHLLSTSQSLSTLSIQFSICPCLNLSYQTLFLKEYNQPLYQL